MKEESTKEEKEETEDSPKEEKEETSDGKGVRVSEEFQKSCHELLSSADKHELSYLRNLVSEKEDELRKGEREVEETKRVKKAKKMGVPKTFSSENMPSVADY